MKNFFKLKKNIILLFILAIAAFMRLYRIEDFMTFLGDEGRDVLTVYNILHGHITLLGPTSSVGGFFLGPIYYYFMAPFLFLFNYNPVGPSIMIALFGIATVWLLYKVADEFFGSSIAMVASLLYALSPLIIIYSRSSWNPNPMPFFTLLTLFLLYKGIKKDVLVQGYMDLSSRADLINTKKEGVQFASIFFYILSGISFGILMQLHYSAFWVGGVIAGYILISNILCAYSKKTTSIISTGLALIKCYVLFLAGFIIGFLPYEVFELRHDFANTRHIIAFIFHSGDTGGSIQFLPTIVDIFSRTFGRVITAYPSGDQISHYTANGLVIWYGFSVCLGIVSVSLMVYQFLKYLRKDMHNTAMENGIALLQKSLLLVWLVIGILLFGFYKKAIYDYYLAFLYPVPFLFVGNLLLFLWKKSSFTKIIGVLIFIVILALNIQETPIKGNPNRQLHQAETISRFVFDQTQNRPFNFALITGGNSDYAYRYFFTLWHNPPMIIQNTVVDPRRTTVTGQLFVVCESIPCHPLGGSLWEIAGFGRGEVVGHWKVSVVEVYKLVHYYGK